MIAPRPNETDDEYRARNRRAKLLRWLVPVVVTLAVVGALFLYTALTMKPNVKFGERCDPDTRCEHRGKCLLEGQGTSGTCTLYCEHDRDCPATYACKLADLVEKFDEHVQGTGAMMRVCLPSR